ncbi:MAG: TRAP transporter large permease [Rhodospirillales bacterium]|jgi:C4-dicarboxylate transporter, DctM subunit|nr:TRAP transporter large permease [Rhodospirillales bacterium]
MDPIIAGVIAVFVMLALIFIGVPIAFALAVVGVVGNAVFLGVPQTAVLVQITAWEIGTNFLLIAVPLFIFMGQLVYQTGIASDLFDFVYKWFGRMPGGLAVTVVITSAGFGAVTGSSVAAVSTMGTMVMPEMRKYKYNLRMATGSLASAGTLAILIPPSIPLVIYGVWTESSIGKLFIAGIIPGVLMAAAFCGMIVVRCVLNREMGPPGPRFPWSERLASLKKLLPTAVIFGVVLGGIYGGFFTPTEASAIGAAGVVVVAALMGRLTWARLRDSLFQSGLISAMVFAILLGGVLLSRFLVQTDVTSALVQFIGGQDVNRYVVIFMFALMYLTLGAVLDTFGMLILTLPFVFPIVLELGFDRIWFGIFMTMMMELALITPPIGLNVYVMNKSAPDVPLSEIFIGTIPFVIACLIMVALITAFPGLALWLPSTMG